MNTLGMARGRTCLGRRCVEFVISISHSRRDVEPVLIYVSLEFRRNFRDVNVDVSVQRLRGI